MGWRNRPTYKKNLPNNVDYVMFIDENGDTSFKHIKKCIKNGIDINVNDKFFTVTGCIIEKDNLKNIKDSIMELKHKYWEDALYFYKDRQKRVCFHSSEIRGEKGPFSKTVINRNNFLNDLSDFMSDLDINILSSSIDKERHVKLYSNPYHPYNLCLKFILERFVKYYIKSNKTGIIVLESRGKKEDKFILEYIKELIDNGSEYVNKEQFKKIKGIYFNPKWCKESNFKKSYFGLELKDLVSHPIRKYSIKNEKDRSFDCIEDKIYGYPNYRGKGIKVFP